MRSSDFGTMERGELSGLSAAVRARGAGIADSWSSAARAGLGRGEGELEELLGMDVSELLEELASTLQTGDRKAAVAKRPRAGGGAIQRKIQLREMLRAYQLLRQTLLEQVSDELGRALRSEEAVALNGRLDEILADRASELVEGEVAEYRAASAAQSKYISFLSHDLRGNLNGVLLMLEVMRRELAPRPEFKESVEDLVLTRQSILDTVALMERHILAERLRTRRVQINPRPVELSHIVNEALAQVAKTAKDKRLTLDVSVPPAAVVEADADLGRTIVQSLADNAIKYSPGGRVAISADRCTDGMWCLSIRDEGPGMPQERLDTLLDPVKRLELNERGLGLLIAQHAARYLGGRLEGTSEPEKGTTVKLMLPAAK